MSGFIYADSLNWSCVPNQTSAPPPPFYGSPAVYLVLLAAPAAAMIIWLWRNLAPLEEFADQIAPIADPPQLPEEQPQSPQLQIPAAPRLPDEQPCRVRSILDANQVPGAIDAISSSMEENMRPISAPWPPQAESSNCDGSGSSSSDDGRNHMVELFQYPSIDSLEAGDARLIDANYMVQLQEMIRGLPEAARVEMVRRAFRYTEEESGDLYR